MKHQVLFLLFLCFGFSLESQTISSSRDSSQLEITVVDVVSMKDVTGYKLTIANAYDTITFQVDSIRNLYFNLDSCIEHTVSVSKTGYRTVSTTWKYPDDSTYVLVEFFLPKESLTKEEKRTAHENTSRLPDWNPEQRGGFEKVTPGRNEMFTARVRMKTSGHETGMYETADL